MSADRMTVMDEFLDHQHLSFGEVCGSLIIMRLYRIISAVNVNLRDWS